MMTRIFHPYDKWEDYRHNFYGGVLEFENDKTLNTYADLLKDLTKFEAALKHIIFEWTYSCEHNLSNESMNRIAYLGQASNALVNKVPYNISMGAYSLLTPEEQKAADAMAEKYLNLWLEKYEHSKKISRH
jgi:hypothetical protein